MGASNEEKDSSLAKSQRPYLSNPTGQRIDENHIVVGPVNDAGLKRMREQGQLTAKQVQDIQTVLLNGNPMRSASLNPDKALVIVLEENRQADGTSQVKPVQVFLGDVSEFRPGDGLVFVPNKTINLRQDHPVAGPVPFGQFRGGLDSHGLLNADGANKLLHMMRIGALVQNDGHQLNNVGMTHNSDGRDTLAAAAPRKPNFNQV